MLILMHPILDGGFLTILQIPQGHALVHLVATVASLRPRTINLPDIPIPLTYVAKCSVSYRPTG